MATFKLPPRGQQGGDHAPQGARGPRKDFPAIPEGKILNVEVIEVELRDRPEWAVRDPEDETKEVSASVSWMASTPSVTYGARQCLGLISPPSAVCVSGFREFLALTSSLTTLSSSSMMCMTPTSALPSSFSQILVASMRVSLLEIVSRRILARSVTLFRTFSPQRLLSSSLRVVLATMTTTRSARMKSLSEETSDNF
jgi:hypothetical protein